MSFAGFLGRRLAALALTVVLAPTVAWTVFTGLSGTAGQSLAATAVDYVVTTFWHFDLGRSISFLGIYREIRSVFSYADLPLIQGMIIETTAMIVLVNMAADLIQARVDPRAR
jgi:hypothetical protein